jgi:uncharacterized DUF497 family protein
MYINCDNKNMEIIWDSGKNRSLAATRHVSFDDIVPIILDKRYIAVLENPSRPDQTIFLVRYGGYTYVVPFEFDGSGNMVLKTIFPSRKFHKMYGARKDEDEA